MIVQPTLDDRAACAYPPRVPRFGGTQRRVLRMLSHRKVHHAEFDHSERASLARLRRHGHVYMDARGWWQLTTREVT